MAKLYIRREADGTYRLRAQRLAGKEMAAQKILGKVTKQGLRAAVTLLMDEVAPRAKKQPVI